MNLDQIAIFEKSLAWRPGTLKLPKFTIADWYDAAKALKKLGVRSVFDSDDSLRPEFSPYGGKLFDIQVRNRMKVDERGTTLINVTEMSGGVIGGVPSGMPRPEVPFEMIVDRPFLFYIVDDVTREVLYLGAVVEP